jgi:hypothetical protein
MDRLEELTINLPYRVDRPLELVNDKQFPLTADELTRICGEATIELVIGYDLPTFATLPEDFSGKIR